MTFGSINISAKFEGKHSLQFLPEGAGVSAPFPIIGQGANSRECLPKDASLSDLAFRSSPQVAQFSFHDAPIFRLLLEIAVF